MKERKMTKAEKLQSDIRFVKSVAVDYVGNITDEQAKRALKVCGDDYHRLKEYLNN
jgi:hypothetical protein